MIEPCPFVLPRLWAFKDSFGHALDLLASHTLALFPALTVLWIDLFLDLIITICEIADIKASASALCKPLAIIYYLNATV